MPCITSNIAEICYHKGIRNVVISPGSRSALLTVHFARHSGIRPIVVIDERSAGYIAMGIAQQTNSMVALVCTSGTAVLNYAPAVAEAYYLKIPMLVLTADRPPEWIGQQDGQAIMQENAFGPHVKGRFTLPVDVTHPDAQWHHNRLLSEAINLGNSPARAPVHVNVPIREPFYQELAKPVTPVSRIKMIEEYAPQSGLTDSQWTSLGEAARQHQRIVILVGQYIDRDGLGVLIRDLARKHHLVVVGDVLSNLTATPGTFNRVDGLLGALSEESFRELEPDLLITFGDAILSRHVKEFFRRSKVRNHWHIQEAGPVADPFKSLTCIVRIPPTGFFREWADRIGPLDATYARKWNQLQALSCKVMEDYFAGQPAFSEFRAIRAVLAVLPGSSSLHLGNSMAVRYAGLIGIDDSSIRVYSNRGTSGIDGTMSTAVGHALASDGLHTLIIGDVSFFYDRNALWHAQVPRNLRIVLINNHGGGIFKLIDGPASLPEVDKFFVASQSLNAESTAREMGLDYTVCHNLKSLEAAFATFHEPSESARILEVVTDMEINTACFSEYRERMKRCGAGLALVEELPL
jgi:2-succinyl-5-enolpyruvyl-6-hydroxy-3-cyclohexene-1-carboxylate synthase